MDQPQPAARLEDIDVRFQLRDPVYFGPKNTAGARRDPGARRAPPCELRRVGHRAPDPVGARVDVNPACVSPCPFSHCCILYSPTSGGPVSQEAGRTPSGQPALLSRRGIRSVSAGSTETKMIPNVTSPKLPFTKGMFPKR